MSSSPTALPSMAGRVTECCAFTLPKALTSVSLPSKLTLFRWPAPPSTPMGRGEGQSPPGSLAVEMPFVLGFALLAWLAALLAVNGTAFLLARPVSRGGTVLATVISLGLAWRAFVSRVGRRFRLALGALAALSACVVLAVWFAGLYYDVSGDGRLYHQEAILHLARGWNPVQEGLRAPEAQALWIDGYAKGTWICAAALLQWTHHMEQGKGLNVLAMGMAFLLSLHALLAWRVGAGLATAIAALAACNPVAICQSLSFYVDGQLACYLTALLALALAAFRAHDGWNDLAIALCALCLVNLKLTGGPYVVVALAAIALGMRWRGHAWRRTAASGLAGLMLGALIVGFSPYVTNAREHGHPLYPVEGRDRLDVMQGSRPSNLIPMNRARRLVTSLFSRSANVTAPAGTRLKWPFQVLAGERAAFGIPDTRAGGFGPLFGGVLVLSGLLLLLLWRRAPRVASGAVALTVAILASALIHSEGWWARYAPQVWLIPSCLVAAAAVARVESGLWLARGVVGVAFLNVYLVFGSYLHFQNESTRSIREQIGGMKKSGKLVRAYFREFRSEGILFAGAGVPFEQVASPEALGCREPMLVTYLDARVCLADDERRPAAP
jgi:hypothetical protein